MPSSTDDSVPAGGRVFATTHWSMVLSARGDSTRAQGAVAGLCEAYWYPLYAFVRRQGHRPHDAQDLTQEFFARFLEKGWIDNVDRERGRFRSFLLAAMKHFLANEWDRVRAAKRGGNVQIISIDDTTAEALYAHEPADPATAESLYERRWALTLLDRVMVRLREEFTAAGKLAQFDALKGTLTGDKTAYAEIATALRLSEGAVKVSVHRLRERYRALLRTEIAQTVTGAQEVEDELRQLFAALST